MTSQPVVVVADAWRDAAAGAGVGVLVLRGVANPRSHPAIDRLKDEVQRDLRTRFGPLDRSALRGVEPLPAYAAYYKRFGQRYHVGMQVESVAQKGKDLPSVAALVESMFAAELRNLVLTAGHDFDDVTLPLRLDVAPDTDPVRFAAPNGQEQSVKPGDMYLADATGVLSSVITGPSAVGRISPGTTSVLFVAYAPPGVSADLLSTHLDDLEAVARLITPDAETTVREIVRG